jgi:hypothetical protein
MQTPTTPSGSPAQQPGDQTCPNCGAPNGATVAFCYQCYQPFGAYQTPPRQGGSQPDRGPWTPGMPAAPPAWTRTPSPFDAPARRRWDVGRIVAMVLVTLAAIGLVNRWVGRDGSVALPEQFGGLGRMENAQTELMVDAFRRQLETMGVEGDIAMYGAGLPTAGLVWIRDAAVPTTDAAFDEFATGFDSGIGAAGSLDGSRKTVETLDGVTYVCAPLESYVSGTICMWQDQEVFWLLFDLSGGSFEAGKALAESAHDAASAA